jgi:hypothetical protein
MTALHTLVESQEKPDYKSLLDTYFNLFSLAYWMNYACLLLLSECEIGYIIKNVRGVGREKPTFSCGPILTLGYILT